MLLSALLLVILPALVRSLSLPLTSDACERRGTVAVSTPLGPAVGTVTTAGADKFVVRYATAPVRWGAPVVANAFLSPNIADPSAMPPMCPQPDADPSTYSEDCLHLVLYVPPNTRPSASLPVLIWIHGGSFVIGSASDPGLDGSLLAIATNSIVAVVQYRLGALGFLPPNPASPSFPSVSNPAVRDVLAALQFLHVTTPSFGGSTARFTVAGQSSGASMVKALLSAPSAASLFAHAWLHSDPMNYALLPPSSLTPFAASFYSSLPTVPQLAPLSSILDAQTNTLNDLAQPFNLPGPSEPLRPTLDGQLITSSFLPNRTSYFSNDATLPSGGPKPIVLTTVSAEAGPADYGNPAFASPLPAAAFVPILESVLGEPRASVVANSAYYAPAVAQSSADIRPVAEQVGTDYIWRCATYALARAYAAQGGKVYVGQFEAGATYPSNAGVAAFCNESPAQVCHQDDIYILFGTTPDPTAAQQALTKELQGRYAGFLLDGVPGGDWRGVQGSNVGARVLGGPQDGGEVPVGACAPGFWGAEVEFDWQVYSQ